MPPSAAHLRRAVHALALLLQRRALALQRARARRRHRLRALRALLREARRALARGQRRAVARRLGDLAVEARRARVGRLMVWELG